MESQGQSDILLLDFRDYLTTKERENYLIVQDAGRMFLAMVRMHLNRRGIANKGHVYCASFSVAVHLITKSQQDELRAMHEITSNFQGVAISILTTEQFSIELHKRRISHDISTWN